MTRVKSFVATLVLASVIGLAGTASTAAPAGPPTPICNPSWGSITLPICV